MLLRRYCSSYKRISVINNTAKPGDAFGVRGWIQNVRRLKNNIFLDINDGSTGQKFQVVVPKVELHKNISTGSSIFASGSVQVAPNGSFELHADEVKVIADGNLSAGYPFTPKQQHPPDYVREQLHLRSRIDYIAAAMRLRHRAQKSIHDFMDKMGFVQINTPIITTNDCEGAGEVFHVQADSMELLKGLHRPGIPLEDSFFDGKVYLSVSGQLHLEAMAYGLGNTYTLLPAFRAENSKSPLHLAEFYMFEAELAFIAEISELNAFIERMIKTITTTILDESAGDLALCQKRALGSASELPWLKSDWKTLTYDEALGIIQNNTDRIQTVVSNAGGFSKEQELFLVSHCNAPVFVVDWPVELKPFYMKVSRSDATRVHAVDLLMPGVAELCGGSLREDDLEHLHRHPHLPKGLEWYLELRKFGGIPTGGFGMGFERYLQLITGVKNIRDVIPFPRYPHSCKM